MRNKALKLGSRFRTGRLAFLSCCEQAWCDSLAIGDGTSEQNYEARCTMTPALSGLAFFISTPAVTSRAVSKLGLWHRLLNECRFSSAQRRLSADAFVVRLEVRLSWHQGFFFFFFNLFPVWGWYSVKYFWRALYLAPEYGSRSFIFHSDIQLTRVHHWMCLSFISCFWLFIRAPWLDCFLNEIQVFCTWQFPISLHFWFMDTTAIKFGTG